MWSDVIVAPWVILALMWPNVIVTQWCVPTVVSPIPLLYSIEPSHAVLSAHVWKMRQTQMGPYSVLWSCWSVKNTKKFSSYLEENNSLHYKVQLVNAVYGNYCCLFWASYETHKNTLWANCRVTDYESRWYVYLPPFCKVLNGLKLGSNRRQLLLGSVKTCISFASWVTVNFQGQLYH
jgi:hypothetical protein